MQMIDCHRHIHDNNDGSYPNIKDMTNVNAGRQADGIKTVQSKIDYSLCSKSLASKLTSVTSTTAPSHGRQNPGPTTTR